MNLSTKIGAAALLLLPSSALGQFSINFSFSDPLTSDQQAAFDAAANTWEGLISGYQAGISLTGVEIAVDSNSAQPNSGPIKALVQGGFVVSEQGRIFFDPLSPPSSDPIELEILVTQSVAAVLGFGTLWEANGLYARDSGEYTGINGLAAYQAEFDPSATFIPVELYSGESNVHWDEIDLGAGLTGITDSRGQDFGNELMTAWVGPSPSDAFVSQTTVGALQDLGFTTATAVPEPSTVLLGAIGALAGLFRRKRGE